MRYHLDTIPVWDAFKQEEYCPFCFLFRKREVIQVDRTLGGAVMEPDTRIRMNDRGFCAAHHRQLYALQNRLGHALIMESHLNSLIGRAEKILQDASSSKTRGGLFRKETDIVPSGQMKKLTDSCLICESLENDMAQYAYTAAILFDRDSEFAAALEKSHLCLKHIALLMAAGEEHLNTGARQKLYAVLLKSMKRDGERCCEDIGIFARSFDYRNAGKGDIPKNALEKAVNFSRERCLGSDPAKENSRRT